MLKPEGKAKLDDVIRSLDGVQYVTVIAGRGGNGPTRLYTFKLDGNAAMPAMPAPATKGKAK